MQINKATNLGQLAEYLGPDATKEDAQKMLDALIALGYDDIAGIDEAVWAQIVYDTFG